MTIPQNCQQARVPLGASQFSGHPSAKEASVLTVRYSRSRHRISNQKRFRKPCRWTIGVVALALLSFLGTSVACFQPIAGSVTLAEACCKGRCQHVMTGRSHRLLPAASRQRNSHFYVHSLSGFVFATSAFFPLSCSLLSTKGRAARVAPLSCRATTNLATAVHLALYPSAVTSVPFSTSVKPQRCSFSV
jgi:hypothetical protein